MRREPLGVPAGDTAWSPHGWPLIFVVNSGAYEFGTRHRGLRPNLWRLDGLGSRPYPILRQPGIEVRPAISPDGTKVAYVRRLKRHISIWVANVDGSEPHQVFDRPPASAPAWAPDSKHLAVSAFSARHRRFELFVAPVSGGGPQLVSRKADPVGPATWGPGVRWITYGAADGSIWRIRPGGADRQKLGELPDRELRRLLWSPDGSHLAYTAPPARDESVYGSN